MCEPDRVEDSFLAADRRRPDAHWGQSHAVTSRCQWPIPVDEGRSHLCFVGSNGLIGVEQGTVRFTVNGDQLAFTFSGRFRTYDGKGGESSDAIAASGSGTASIRTE